MSLSQVIKLFLWPQVLLVMELSKAAQTFVRWMEGIRCDPAYTSHRPWGAHVMLGLAGCIQPSLDATNVLTGPPISNILRSKKSWPMNQKHRSSWLYCTGASLGSVLRSQWGVHCSGPGGKAHEGVHERFSIQESGAGLEFSSVSEVGKKRCFAKVAFVERVGESRSHFTTSDGHEATRVCG